MSVFLSSEVACVTPMSHRGRLDEAVQEVNIAVRFGRQEVALERVAKKSRETFFKQHRAWGREISIADVEFSGLEKLTELEAEVLISFSWFRLNEGRVRTTSIRQTWRREGDDGAWVLVEEKHANGDVGLLGERVVIDKPQRGDMRFPTKVIVEREP